MKIEAAEIQAKYYQQTANSYESLHVHSDIEEHNFALHFLSSVIKMYSIQSILDVGAGTGRTIDFIKREHPNVRIIGIEPVKELREQGYKKGISPDILIDGDGNKMNFENGEFDLVCEFAVLHHVPKPDIVVSEMLRVAKKCIFISDANNFGQGSWLNRSFKQTLNFFGLWRLFDLVRTGNKGYHISDTDGLFYSYSVFNNYKQIRAECQKVHLVNTLHSNMNLYRTAPHVALLGIK